MVLVGYSDSEGSDVEDTAPTSTKATAAAAKPSSKPAFQKVVDRANPHRIRVNLPSTATQGPSKDEDDTSAPPAKRARTAGGFGGFNAMLPAPKKPTQPATSTSSSAPRRGLGVGVNLKTGAQPAFSREPVEPTAGSDYNENGAADYGEEEYGTSTSTISQKEPEPVKLVGKPTAFRPLSVTNKNKKKKKTVSELAVAAAAAKANAPLSEGASSTPGPASASPPKKPRVSLFSLGATETVDPLPALDDDLDDLNGADGTPDVANDNHAAQPPAAQANTSTTEETPNIADTLNLTASERRQLFGRRGKGDISAINFVNFNTDAEYAANEAARASGEAEAAAQQVKGVRAIAPGKHSLKQLVNAATSQKDALEESFAQGRRNKKEAGNKYGW